DSVRCGMKKSVLVRILPLCALLLSCVSEHKPPTAAAPVAATAAAAQAAAKAETFNLVGSEWVLDALAGSGVVSGVRATLSFPEAGKIAGNGSCNRFFGASEIAGTSIKFTGLGSTRLAWPDPAMTPGSKQLIAAQRAD